MLFAHAQGPFATRARRINIRKQIFIGHQMPNALIRFDCQYAQQAEAALELKNEIVSCGELLAQFATSRTGLGVKINTGS